MSSLQSSVAGVQNNPDEILPRLMNQLIDEDSVVVLETQVMVEKLAKKENFFNAMIRNVDFVGAIIQSLVIAMTTLNHAANALAAANNANESGKLYFGTNHVQLYWLMHITFLRFKIEKRISLIFVSF